MEVKLTKKELKFLVGVIGPMHEEQYKENIRKSLTLNEKEKEIIIKYVDELRVTRLFNKLSSLSEEKSLHYK